MPGLKVYIEHGEVEIDNNGIENAIRPSAVGKKNYLFIGNAERGATAAIMYTLAANATRLKANFYEWTKWALENLPKKTNQTQHELSLETWSSQARLPQ
jgi:hypothetical protein